MIRFTSDNKQALSPNFVSSALAGLTHRFVLVLECETRMYNDSRRGPVIAPPRFAIGGPRATLDPRNARVEELMPLAKHKLELPHGWERIHQYIYVLQPNTDEHGWQYRSEWSDGPITESDEQWMKVNSPGLDVRRRLWMITVVKRDDVVAAKRRLADALTNRTRHVVLEGELFRQEPGALMKTWSKRWVTLYDDLIEIYSGGSRENGGKKISEITLGDCDAKMLFGNQCPQRDFAFSVKQLNGPVLALFDAENREIRRRWVVALRYQLAMLCPEMNFAPFDYGPPSSEDLNMRMLMCGELQKQGQMVRQWKQRYFYLLPSELQYYDKENLKGFFALKDATVSVDDKSNDFSLRTADNRVVTMRAASTADKMTWVKALSRQVLVESIRDNDDDEGPPTPSKPVTPTKQEAPAAAVPTTATVVPSEVAPEPQVVTILASTSRSEEEVTPKQASNDEDEGGNEVDPDNDSDLGELQEIDSDDDVEAVQAKAGQKARRLSSPTVTAPAVVAAALQPEPVPVSSEVPAAEQISAVVVSVEEVPAVQPATETASAPVEEATMVTEPEISTPATDAAIEQAVVDIEDVKIEEDANGPAVSSGIVSEPESTPDSTVAEKEDITVNAPVEASEAEADATDNVKSAAAVEVSSPTSKTIYSTASLRPVSVSSIVSADSVANGVTDSPSAASASTAPASWQLKGSKLSQLNTSDSSSTTEGAGSASAAAASNTSPRVLVPFGIDETNANKATKYAAKMARKAQQAQQEAEDEGWGSFGASNNNPTTPQAASSPDGEQQQQQQHGVNLITKKAHSYVPTTVQFAGIVPKSSEPVKPVLLRAASTQKLVNNAAAASPGGGDDDFGQSPESAIMSPAVVKVKEKLSRRPSMVLEKILKLETNIVESTSSATTPGKELKKSNADNK